MKHLTIALTITMAGAAVLTFIYYYLYRKEKSRFMGYWSLSWFCYFIGLCFSAILMNKNICIRAGRLFEQIFFYLSSIFLFYGTCIFAKRDFPKHVKAVITAIALWISLGVFKFIKINIISIPIFIFFGAAFIWSGIILYKEICIKTVPLKVTIVSFILQGLNNVAHPFIKNIRWYTPWEYTLGAILKMLIAVSFIVIYFESTKKELIEAQKVIEKNEKKLKDIIDRQRDMILETDDNGVITFVSNASKDIFDFYPNEVLGRKISDFITLDTYIKIIESFENCGQIECESFDRKGNKIYLSISWKKNIEQGKFKGIIGAIRDITENKLLEKAIEYDKLKTELFINLSHDFKTPLNVILSSIQLLELCRVNDTLMENNYEKFDRYMEVIKHNCYKLMRQINNSIDMSKLETGFYELNFKNKNIVSVIEDITMSVLEYTESKHIELQFDTEMEEKIMALDEEKIERIMLNLLSNAIKFTPEGGRIYVNIFDKDKSIMISVRDTGIGIPESMMDSIFKRYSIVRDENSPTVNGSGIGLSIVKSLVELHKGTIKVKSTYGEGSEFIIDLPCFKIKDNDTIIVNSELNKNTKDKVVIELSNL